MSEYIITIEQIKDLVTQSAVEAIDGYKSGVVKQIWQYPSLPKIVRCSDCRLQDEFKYCERLGFKVGNNGYCAWPVRKD